MNLLWQRSIFFYPLIFAAFSPIFLYADNPNEGISILEFIVPLAAVIVCTAILVLLLSPNPPKG